MADKKNNRTFSNKPESSQPVRGNSAPTVKKVVERAFHDIYEELRIFSEQTLMAIVVLQDGKIKYANQVAADILEYTVPEMLAWETNGFVSVIHPDDAAFVIEQAEKKQAGEKDVVTQYSYRIVTKNGRIKWLDQYSYTIDYQNKFADLVTFIDISKSRKDEEELRKQSDFINAILETAGALVVVLDPKGRIVRFNRACEESTGYTFNEVKGKCLWDFLISPEEVEPVKKVFDELRSGLFPNQYENRWISKDGDLRCIMWSNTALVDESGAVEFVIATGIDITDRKRAEEALQKAHDELQARIRERTDELEEANRRKKAMFDLYTIFELSRNFNAMLDYQSLLDSFVLAAMGRMSATRAALYLPLELGRKEFQLARAMGIHPFPDDQITVREESQFSQYIANLNRPIQIDDIREKFASSEDFGFMEYFKNGLVIPLVFQTKLRGILILSGKESGQKYLDNDIEFLSILASQTAVSIENARLYESEKEALSKLHNTQKLLVQSERLAALGDLSAKIAHEINNPLGIIKNYLSLFTQNIDCQDAALDNIVIIKQEINRIAMIVRQLLDFHRPMKIKFERINPSKIVSEALSLMEWQLKNAGVLVSFHTGDNIPEISAWADGMKQVFINLIVNAMDAMKDGGKISINISRSEHTVIYSIEDTGPGIETEHIPHIFDSFFTTKESSGGSGLGLSICHRIIKNHNGSINYSNTQDGGCFRIELPIEQEGTEYDWQI